MASVGNNQSRHINFDVGLKFLLFGSCSGVGKKHDGGYRSGTGDAKDNIVVGDDNDGGSNNGDLFSFPLKLQESFAMFVITSGSP